MTPIVTTTTRALPTMSFVVLLLMAAARAYPMVAVISGK